METPQEHTALEIRHHRERGWLFRHEGVVHGPYRDLPELSVALARCIGLEAAGQVVEEMVEELCAQTGAELVGKLEIGETDDGWVWRLQGEHHGPFPTPVALLDDIRDELGMEAAASIARGMLQIMQAMDADQRSLN